MYIEYIQMKKKPEQNVDPVSSFLLEYFQRWWFEHAVTRHRKVFTVKHETHSIVKRRWFAVTLGRKIFIVKLTQTVRDSFPITLEQVNQFSKYLWFTFVRIPLKYYHPYIMWFFIYTLSNQYDPDNFFISSLVDKVFESVL